MVLRNNADDDYAMQVKGDASKFDIVRMLFVVCADGGSHPLYPGIVLRSHRQSTGQDLERHSLQSLAELANEMPSRHVRIASSA